VIFLHQTSLEEKYFPVLQLGAILQVLLSLAVKAWVACSISSFARRRASTVSASRWSWDGSSPKSGSPDGIGTVHTAHVGTGGRPRVQRYNNTPTKT
jgi:hypothetical protein